MYEVIYILMLFSIYLSICREGRIVFYSHGNDKVKFWCFLNRIQLLVFTYEEAEVRKLWNHEQFEIAEKVIQKKVADELLKDAEETSDTVVAIILLKRYK